MNWITGQLEDELQPEIKVPWVDTSAEGASPEDFMPAEEGEEDMVSSNPILNKYSNTDEIYKEADDLQNQRRIAGEIAESDAMQKPDSPLSRQQELLKRIQELRARQASLNGDGLDKAEEKMERNMGMMGMLQGADTIGRAFASGRGANVPAMDLKALEQMGKQPVARHERNSKNLTDQIKNISGEIEVDKMQQMNDPGSPISKMYTDLAQNMAREVGYDIGKHGPMTAEQLSKLMYNLSYIQSGKHHQEATKSAREDKKDETKRKEAILTDKQVSVITNYDNLLSAAKRLREEKGDYNTGWFSNMANGAAQWVNLDDAKKSAFKAEVGSNLADYVRSISGTAASDNERKTLQTLMPSFRDDDDTFMEKLNKFEEKAKEFRNNHVTNMRKLGKNTEEFELQENQAPVFPKTVRKGNEIVEVYNEQELKEAQEEGFQ